MVVVVVVVTMMTRMMGFRLLRRLPLAPPPPPLRITQMLYYVFGGVLVRPSAPAPSVYNGFVFGFVGSSCSRQWWDEAPHDAVCEETKQKRDKWRRRIRKGDRDGNAHEVRNRIPSRMRSCLISSPVGYKTCVRQF